MLICSITSKCNETGHDHGIELFDVYPFHCFFSPVYPVLKIIIKIIGNNFKWSFDIIA